MRTLWTLFAAWLLLCAGQLATAQDRIFVTEDANGLLVFQRLSTNSDGLLVGVQVPGSEITFIDMTGRGPDDPTDPPPTPGNARLRKLEAEVRQLVTGLVDPDTANGLGVALVKISDGLRDGKVPGATLLANMSKVLDAIILFRPAWRPLKAISVSAIDNLKSEVGQFPSDAAYADTLDAVIRGLGNESSVRAAAATIMPGVDETTLRIALEATTEPALDWAFWLQLILTLLREWFPGLGF